MDAGTEADLYEQWKPSDVAFIKSLNWSTNTITMVVYAQDREKYFSWPDFLADFIEISLHFEGVKI